VATRLRILLPVALGAALLVSACGRGRGGAPEKADGPLPPWVTTEQLMPLVVERRAVVFDSRARSDYAAGHITGAWPLPLDELAPPGGDLDGTAKEHVAAALAATGFDPGAELVVTDGGGPEGLRRAAAGCWLLALAGARRCTLLTGGTDAWRAAGGDLVIDEPTAPKEPARIRIHTRPPALASLDFVREATARPEGAIVDVRGGAGGDGRPGDDAHGSGEVFSNSSVQHDGAIPGAIAWPLPQPALSGAAGAPFDATQLERSAAAAGLFAEREIVVVGDGLEDGALGWFVLRYGLGVRDAKLFPGGVAAWRGHAPLPFAPTAAVEPQAAPQPAATLQPAAAL